jgi:hypothetical protein
MQEFIVLLIAAIALIYLSYKFISKKKAHNCEKCGLTDDKQVKH